MTRHRKPTVTDIDENDVQVSRRKHAAAGVPAVAVSMKRSIDAMGFRRTAQTLLKLNQVDGFDCQGCAWPDPDPEHRHHAEFCENGAKAVAEEATTDHVKPEFFAEHSIAELEERSDYWLGNQGRIVHPMVRRRDATHYEPISWTDAFTLIGETLKGLDSPDEAIFYTSGKTSNEAAFAYQLFARAYGTNNLPDCSNMCHESTSVALAETIGIGKGSVSLEDVHTADLIVISGQNPGTNHPRMLTALEIAKKNGAKILAINPLPEAGLLRFKNPQKVRGLSGVGTGLADLHLPIRINGDLALWQAIGALLLEDEKTIGGVVDHDFVERSTVHFEEYAAHLRSLDWDAVERATGLGRGQIREAATMLRESTATVHCWAMGITQHRNAVATIKEFVNVALLRGDIGRPGAGLCPVRGHSNVQGDRTMGIWEKAPSHFLDALRDEYGFEPPREDGLDTVDAIRALRDGKAKVFVGMGGNFVSAAPDTLVTEQAMQRRRADRDGVDEAQPLARALRAHRADPARPRPQRARPHRRHGPAGHRRGLDVRGARVPGSTRARRARPQVRGRHRLPDRRGHAGRREPGALGRLPLRLHQHPSGDRGRRAGLRVVRREDAAAGRLRAAAPASRLAHVPHGGGQGDLQRQPDGRAARAGGAAAAAEPAQPRPVQHHDLRSQ